jgi:hypothetical protein
MNMDFEEYYQLLFERKSDLAAEYRMKCMPKTIYKYIGLEPMKKCNMDKGACDDINVKNELKFSTLEAQSIWLSKFKHLNDPFEYRAMFIDKEKLLAKGWDIKFIEEYLARMKSIYNIASFTENLVDNMPMWAHYANNHQGFCIEYTVLHPKMLFPISYEKERFAVASMLVNILSKVCEIEEGTINEQDDDFQFYMWMITHFGLVKHESWKYENELRILYPSQEFDQSGVMVKAINLGLYPSAVYIGNQCSRVNKNKLIKIAEKLKTPIFEMYLDEDDGQYRLSSKPVV